jgi:hypothetical protein
MVVVQLTNGFGNNLFQYIAAKQLASFHDSRLYVIPPSPDYYAISGLKDVGVDFVALPLNDERFVAVDDANYKMCFDTSLPNYNFQVRGYFEDYTLFHKNMEQIKSWFPRVETRDDNDLVIHFRAGDRLFYKNEFDTKPTVASYMKALSHFDFDKLHIVTDMPNWDYITAEQLLEMKFHYDVPAEQRVPPERSVEYFNSFVEAFSVYEPTVKRRTVSEDFNHIRTFKNILFQHGTLGWWAAMLSDASRVGVYGPWRPWKGKSNKNLSQIKKEGWFQWK